MLGIGLFLVVCIFVFSDSWYWGWNDKNIDKSIKTGVLLISKLDEFHDRHGKFPGQLSDLIPDYIDTLPLPSAGEKEWHYYTHSNGDGFSLKFAMPPESALPGYPCCFYSSKSGRWYVDD